jgi:hypothetical protein
MGLSGDLADVAGLVEDLGKRSRVGDAEGHSSAEDRIRGRRRVANDDDAGERRTCRVCQRAVSILQVAHEQDVGDGRGTVWANPFRD